MINFTRTRVLTRLFLMLSVILLISSCTSDRTLADGGLIQKRRYQKGYHLNFRSNPQKSHKDAEAVKPGEAPDLTASANTKELLPPEVLAPQVQQGQQQFDPPSTEVPDLRSTNEKPAGTTESNQTDKRDRTSVEKSATEQPDYYTAQGDARSVNVLSLLSFIFALISLFVAGIPLGTAAVICGIIGLNQISKNPMTEKGRGFAIVGIIIGLISVIVVLAYVSTL